jgi:hypothetical protein
MAPIGIMTERVRASGNEIVNEILDAISKQRPLAIRSQVDRETPAPINLAALATCSTRIGSRVLAVMSAPAADTSDKPDFIFTLTIIIFMAVNKHEIGSDRRSAGCAEVKAHAIPNHDWASLQGERAPRPTSGTGRVAVRA